MIEEFNKLQQDGTSDEYLAKFEELKALLLVRTPTMPTSYFLESFIGGLKPAVKPLVRAANPQTLDMAIAQARFHEEHIIALKLPPDRLFKIAPIYLINSTKALLPTHTLNPKTPQNFPPKAEKMAKRLCFFCD